LIVSEVEPDAAWLEISLIWLANKLLSCTRFPLT